MKGTRYTAALSLLVVGVLGFSACGSNSSSTSSSSGSARPSVPVNCGGKKKLEASGSTAQTNAIEQFVYAYIRACPGYTLDYVANGSGAGVRQFVNNETDLGGSDRPLNPDKGEPDRAQQRCGSPAWDLPAVFGPIAVTYNLDGVNTLNFDGPTTAKIFNGGITTWNDPAIKALNADANLPATPISVVFRDDKSGTTYNFQKYLQAASDGAWSKGTDETFDGGIGQGASRCDIQLCDHIPRRPFGRENSVPGGIHETRKSCLDDRRYVRTGGQSRGARHRIGFDISGTNLRDMKRRLPHEVDLAT